LALGLGQMVEEDFEVLLGSEAGHGGILERFQSRCPRRTPPMTMKPS
jgi:hypothetical protein